MQTVLSVYAPRVCIRLAISALNYFSSCNKRVDLRYEYAQHNGQVRNSVSESPDKVIVKEVCVKSCLDNPGDTS